MKYSWFSNSKLGFLCFCMIFLKSCNEQEPNPKENLERPNILFILTDDQAYWATGFSGNQQLHTPVLDSLAAQGASFTNFFANTPVCSPSRASLLTSKYGSEVDITDWINHFWDGTLKGPEPHLGLAEKEITWVELLQQSGYETTLIGKWHLGVDPEFHPTAQGFDTFKGFLAGGTKVENPTLEIDGKDSIYQGLTTEILTYETVAFLKNRNTEKPFLISLNYRAPHAPWLPLREEDWAQYRNMNIDLPDPKYPKIDSLDVVKRTREYYGAVTSLDRNLGTLLNTLNDLELEKNTIVVFTSDHGYNLGHNGIWHKGNGHWILTENPEYTENIPEGQRPNMYDHSLRIPVVVKWPNKIKPGTIIESSADVLDWYPTLSAMANVSIPDSILVRGRNLTPILMGQRPKNWNNDVFGQYSTHHQSRTHMRMYRTEDWKLIMDYLNPNRNELYDLKNDPKEKINLYYKKEYQKTALFLEAKLRDYMQKIDDPVLAIAIETNKKKI